MHTLEITVRWESLNIKGIVILLSKQLITDRFNNQEIMKVSILVIYGIAVIHFRSLRV